MYRHVTVIAVSVSGSIGAQFYLALSVPSSIWLYRCAVLVVTLLSSSVVGPRKCVGDNLAKMELFIYFTSVLQAFDIRIPEGMPTPSMEPNVGLNMSPKEYRISATHR